jgi:hypothetical protein
MKGKLIEGIVVKVTEHTIVIMRPEGTFKNIPRSPEQIPRIGEPFSYTERDKSKRPSWSAYISVAAIFLIGILLSTLFIQSERQASYVVAMDVNPSIEIYVDQENNVVKVVALNQDAEKITSHLDSQNEPLSQILEEMITRLVQEGYLSKDKDGMLTTSIVPLHQNGQELNIEKISETMQGHIQQSLERHSIMAQFTITSDQQENLEKAHQMELSINKYKLYQRFVETKLDITLEEVRTGSVSQLLELEKTKIDQLNLEESKSKAEESNENGEDYSKTNAEDSPGREEAIERDNKNKETPASSAPNADQSNTSIPAHKNSKNDGAANKQDKEPTNKPGSQSGQSEQDKSDVLDKPDKLDEPAKRDEQKEPTNNQDKQSGETAEQEEAKQEEITEPDEQTKDAEEDEDQQNQQEDEEPLEEEGPTTEDTSSDSDSPPTNQEGTSGRP